MTSSGSNKGVPRAFPPPAADTNVRPTHASLGDCRRVTCLGYQSASFGVWVLQTFASECRLIDPANATSLPLGGQPMINLTRLNHQTVVVNSDLIKFIENAPDTVLTLTNGEKIVVRESVDEVIRRVIAFRRALLEGLPTLGVDPHTASATIKRPTENHPIEHGRFPRG